MRGWRQMGRLGSIAATVGLLFMLCGCTSLQTTNTAQKAGADVQEEHQAVACPTPVDLVAPVTVKFPYIAPPNSVDLCGEPVPLNRQDVYERFDKEFTLVVYNQAQVYLWLKRMERYFPAIEERLRSYNLPGDLKYVAIVESDLLPNACSPKGAAGPFTMEVTVETELICLNAAGKPVDVSKAQTIQQKFSSVTVKPSVGASCL